MITIISSTNRSNSYSARMARLIHLELKGRNVESQILDLQSLPPHFAWSKIEDQSLPEFDQLAEQYIRDVNKFIFVIPEYNGSFPGILKTFIDSVHPRNFQGKKASLVGISSGRAGALRALDHFTGVLHYLQVEVLSDKPKFPQIDKILNPNNELTDPESVFRLRKNIDKFLLF